MKICTRPKKSLNRKYVHVLKIKYVSKWSMWLPVRKTGRDHHAKRKSLPCLILTSMLASFFDSIAPISNLERIPNRIVLDFMVVEIIRQEVQICIWYISIVLNFAQLHWIL